jgi:plasmid stabilization system protein ParE
MTNYKVKWTPESIKTFNENLEHLSEEWDLQTINRFLDRVDEIIDSISENPYLFQSYNKKYGIHRSVINKHITLFYRIKNSDKIDLITFWNSHKNPNELKL